MPILHHGCLDLNLTAGLSMTTANLNIDELEAGYPLFCKALRLLIIKLSLIHI